MFNIQLAKEDLATALSHVESTVGNNSQNMGDDCISIKDVGNNIVEIYTTNGIEFSKVNLIVTTGSQKPCNMPYVNFKRFKNIIDSIPDKEFISIKSSVNDIEITYGMRKKPLKLSGATNGMPQLPTMTNITDSLTIERNILIKGIDKACTIIKDDDTNPLTNCARIAIQAGNVEITAVDAKSARLFMYNARSSNTCTGEVLIEANKFKKASKMFLQFDELDIESDGNVTSIETCATTSKGNLMSAKYYVRNITGSYPKNFAAKFNGVTEYATINKDEFMASLSRVGAIEDTTIGSGTFDINIVKNIVNITKTSQYGIVEDTFDMENEITNQITDSFKTKSINEILKNIQNNSTSSFVPNTFEIGQCGTSNYYVIKDSKNIYGDDFRFMISGMNNSNNNTP